MKILKRTIIGIVAVLVLVILAFTIVFWAPDRSVTELQSRWAPPPSTFIDVAGMNVHVRDEGPRSDPTPLVLIHGMSASLHTWDGWAQALKSERRVIRFDLPGLGLTGPAPNADYSMAANVRFVTELLDKLGVENCILAGNSLGGNVAWATTLVMPSRVEKLILVDAAGYPLQSISVPIGFRLGRMPLINQLISRTLPRGMIESSVRNVYGDPSKVTPDLVDRYYELTLRAGNRQAFGQRMQQSHLGDQAEHIRELKLPTLILWGGRDRLIPPENAENFKRDIADSRLIVFADLGHVPQEEDPVRTVAAVRSFIAAK